MNHLKPINVLLSTILTLWTFSGAYALEGAQPKFATDLGFKTLTEPGTPSFLKNASKSVYKVQIVSEANPNEVSVFDLESNEFKAFKTKVHTMPKEQLSDAERVTILKQIERCKRDKLIKNCPILLTFERATAFLVGGDGSFLVTNAHVVDRYLKLIAAQEKKSVLELLKHPQMLPLFLFDQNGSLIVDPFVNQPVVFRYGSPSSLAITNSNGWYGDDSDYVVIKLSTPIGEPLKIASSRSESEVLYRLGFSACTGCIEAPNRVDPALNTNRGTLGNSNGRDLYWTAGRSLNLTEAASYTGVSPDYFNTTHKKNWIFFLADSQVGMSGGPILNSAGEAVGIFAGSKPKQNEDGTMTVMSRGVRPPEFNKQ